MRLYTFTTIAEALPVLVDVCSVKPEHGHGLINFLMWRGYLSLLEGRQEFLDDGRDFYSEFYSTLYPLL
jgi:hypothetical protein